MAEGRDRSVNYAPDPTVSRFILDDAFVCGIRGPVGSAKTTGCVMKLIRLAQEQQPDADGWRKTRFVIVRNTGPQLKTTTINTYRYWMGGEDLGDFTWSAPTLHHVQYAIPADGTKVDCEVIFLPLDGDDDIGKVKSLELTAAYCNEMSEMGWEVIEELMKRLGRYPPKQADASGKVVYGCTQRQLIFDTNAPALESKLYDMFEKVKPRGWIMYAQPPAAFRDPNGIHVSAEGTRYRLNPEAENLAWLDEGYYDRAINGVSDRSIQVYVLNEYGSYLSGKPVFTAYNDKVHFSNVPLMVYRGVPLDLTFDFGGTTTALISQFSPTGQLRCIEELCTEMNIVPFINQALIPKLARDYKDIPLADIHIGDPAGQIKGSNGLSLFDELAKAGFPCRAPDLHGTEQNPEHEQRKAAVDHFLTTMVDGEPALLVGPKCPVLRSGFLGKYRYLKQASREGDTVLRPKPLKNHPESDVHDTLQYRCHWIRGARTKKGTDVSRLIAKQRRVAESIRRAGAAR